MDLTYPAAVAQVLERIDQALADVSLQDEVEACRSEPVLWVRHAPLVEADDWSPLTRFAAFRKLGAGALPLGQLLRVSPLGSRDPSAPWQAGDPLLVELVAGKIRGHISVAPLCVPGDELLLLAGAEHTIVLVKVGPEGSQTERLGDAFVVAFEDAPAHQLAQGVEAVAAWERLATRQRLALLGLTLGLMDRAWRIALDALCEGKRQGNILADEQVAQFQLSDIHIDRLVAEHLALDVAIDAEHGRAFEARMAM